MSATTVGSFAPKNFHLAAPQPRPGPSFHPPADDSSVLLLLSAKAKGDKDDAEDNAADNEILYFRQPKPVDKSAVSDAKSKIAQPPKSNAPASDSQDASPKMSKPFNAPTSESRQASPKMNKTWDEDPNIINPSEPPPAVKPESASAPQLKSQNLKNRLTGGLESLKMSAPIGNDVRVGASYKPIPRSSPSSSSSNSTQEGPTSPYTAFGQGGNNLKSLLTGGKESLRMSAPIGNELRVTPAKNAEGPASPYTSLASSKQQQQQGNMQQQERSLKRGNWQQQQPPPPATQQQQTTRSLKTRLTGGSEPLKMSAPLDNLIQVAPFMSIGRTPNSSDDSNSDRKRTDSSVSDKKKESTMDPNSPVQPRSSSGLKTLLTGGPNSLAEMDMAASTGKLPWIAANERDWTGKTPPSTAASRNASLKSSLKSHYAAWKSVSPRIDSKNIKSLLTKKGNRGGGTDESKPLKEQATSASVGKQINKEGLSEEKQKPKADKGAESSGDRVVPVKGLVSPPSPPPASSSDSYGEDGTRKAARATRVENQILKTRLAGGTKPLKMPAPLDGSSTSREPKVDNRKAASMDRASPPTTKDPPPPPRMASDLSTASANQSNGGPNSLKTTAKEGKHMDIGDSPNGPKSKETGRKPVAQPGEDFTSPASSFAARADSRKSDSSKDGAQETKSSSIPPTPPVEPRGSPASSFGARFESWKSNRFKYDTTSSSSSPVESPASPAASFAARYDSRKSDPTKADSRRRGIAPPEAPASSFGARFDSWKSASPVDDPYRDGLWAGGPDSANKGKHLDVGVTGDQSKAIKGSLFPSTGKRSSPTEAQRAGAPSAASFGARYDTWKSATPREDMTYRDGLWNGGPDTFKMSVGRDHHRYVGTPPDEAKAGGPRTDKTGFSRFARSAASAPPAVGVTPVKEENGNTRRPADPKGAASTKAKISRPGESPASPQSAKPSPQAVEGNKKEVPKVHKGIPSMKENNGSATGRHASPARPEETASTFSRPAASSDSNQPAKLSSPMVGGTTGAADAASRNLKRGTESLKIPSQLDSNRNIKSTATEKPAFPTKRTDTASPPPVGSSPMVKPASPLRESSSKSVNKGIYKSSAGESFGDDLSEVERRQILQEVRQHLDILKELEGVISEEEMAKRKSELFAALPPLPPPSDETDTM